VRTNSPRDEWAREEAEAWRPVVWDELNQHDPCWPVAVLKGDYQDWDEGGGAYGSRLRSPVRLGADDLGFWTNDRPHRCLPHRHRRSLGSCRRQGVGAPERGLDQAGLDQVEAVEEPLDRRKVVPFRDLHVRVPEERPHQPPRVTEQQGEVPSVCRGEPEAGLHQLVQHHQHVEGVRMPRGVRGR
jgi:hypothetical protein